MRKLPILKYLTMNSGRAVRNWHRSIILQCESRLGRELTDAEAEFITSRGGFIALEFIEGTVKTLEGEALEQYLNSESDPE